MARHYGIPYMGSKQKLVDKIIPFIVARHSNATDLYDLFGGGGSVSLYALRKYPDITVHYNELSKAISALLQYLKDGGEIPTDFITREAFNQAKAGDDWYAGYLQSCWSFGNGQRSYLYGKDIEEFKHKYHDIVFDKANNLAWLSDFLSDRFNTRVNILLNSKRYTTPYQRRIAISRQLPHHGLRLQHLEWSQALDAIKRLPGLDRIEITNDSYQDVLITGERPVVYCDPPYEKTAEYKEDGFDSAAFYEWAISRPYPVYFSSYKISDKRFTIVKSIKTASLLSVHGRASGKYNFENLYWNGVES